MKGRSRVRGDDAVTRVGLRCRRAWRAWRAWPGELAGQFTHPLALLLAAAAVLAWAPASPPAWRSPSLP